MGSSEAYKKREQTLITKYGSIQAYKDHLRNWGSKGGKNSPGFAADRKRAQEAGRKGGLAYRGK